MPIRIVRLGSPREYGEGVRLGTVRRPPRGVPKSQYAADDWYDVWLPNLSPSAELVKEGLASTSARSWDTFVRRFRAEMKRPESSHLLNALAALSHSASFSMGCYCADESQCHRSVLRVLLEERGAALV
jgi:uncharacterized protein YeaO (DUF488 family)